MTRSQRIALVVILLSAAALRLTGLDWDGFQHHHPDERYISWVATTIEFPSLRGSDWAAQLRPQTATFNPFHWPPGASSEGIVVLQGEPRDFAYGHVPLYLGVIATRLVERVAPWLVPLFPAQWSVTADVLNGAGRVEFHHLTAVGRALTALFDTGTVLLIFLIGRRLYNPNVGLLAAAFLAVAVLHIQIAHFFTSDPYMTFFVVAALHFMVAGHHEVISEGQKRGLLLLGLAAVMAGLAIGSKFTAVLLVLPLAWTALTVGASGNRWRPFVVVTVAIILTFIITNPFAVLDWSCPPGEFAGLLGSLQRSLSRSCYLQNVMTQNAMVRGALDLAFTRQYAGTIPYLYHFEMLLRWGLGPFLGLLGIVGLVWALTDTWRAVESDPAAGGFLSRGARHAVIILLLWVTPYLFLTGSFYVKFIRYMQPIVPFALLFGAAMLWQWRSLWGRRVAAGVCLVAGVLYAVFFIGLYNRDHPWNAASLWIYENVPSGTTILSEQWDDYLPVTMVANGVQRTRTEYPNMELTWLTYPDSFDNEQNLNANLDILAQSDYLTVLSNRVYGVVPRHEERFPISGQYHQLLFDGELGYELVWVGARDPNLFGVSLRADSFGWPGLRPPDGVTGFLAQRPGVSFGRADESFTVYDQPLTMIFRNVAKLSAGEMRAAFEPAGE